jgi:hypothetical protein
MIRSAYFPEPPEGAISDKPGNTMKSIPGGCGTKRASPHEAECSAALRVSTSDTHVDNRVTGKPAANIANRSKRPFERSGTLLPLAEPGEVLKTRGCSTHEEGFRDSCKSGDDDPGRRCRFFWPVDEVPQSRGRCSLSTSPNSAVRTDHACKLARGSSSYPAGGLSLSAS